MSCYVSDRLFQTAGSVCDDERMSANFESAPFSAEWNALQRRERLRMRRLVRMGRSVDDPELAQLAPAYARDQMQRPWMRLFWLWFVPATFLALGATAGIHPVLVGAVIALAAQAAWGWFNLRKTAWA